MNEPAYPQSPSPGSDFRTRRFNPPSIKDLKDAIPGYEVSHLFNILDTGALYRARHSNLDRDVCIKILPSVPEAESADYLETFRFEAHTMAKLHHPSIIKVFDSGETASGLPYFVMEYVEGAILRQMIALGQIGMEHILGWLPPICKALQYAHLQGIVHCDVQPSNILLTNEGEVKLANFRLSLIKGQGLSAGATPSVYAAPELFDGKLRIDYRADIYSLGVVLYEMLTNRLPLGYFPAASEIAGVDTRFDDIIRGALQSDRESRWKTALDISAIIDQIRDYPA